MKNSKTAISALAALGLAVAGIAFAQTSTATPGQGGSPAINASQYVTPQFRVNPGGTILVRGLVVSSVSGSAIQGTFSYGDLQVPMTINVMPNASVYDRSLGRSALSNISQGDVISFSGTITQQGITATVVRDWMPVGGSSTGAGGTGTGSTGGTGTGNTGAGNSGTGNEGSGNTGAGDSGSSGTGNAGAGGTSGAGNSGTGNSGTGSTSGTGAPGSSY